MQWNKLSVSDKAALMRIYIENGITDLDVMQAHYNQQGGKVGRNSNSANSYSSLPNNSRTYERWADAIARHKSINIANDKTYDYRRYYNENTEASWRMLQVNTKEHFPDTYKLPVHPTFSNESVYSRGPQMGGNWLNDSTFVPSVINRQYYPNVYREDRPYTEREIYQHEFQNGGIVTPLGQWQYPGKVTTIPSNNITMQGVNYPVIGISDRGDTKLMMPNRNYQFKGKSVTEYPLTTHRMQEGGTITRGSFSEQGIYNRFPGQYATGGHLFTDGGETDGSKEDKNKRKPDNPPTRTYDIPMVQPMVSTMDPMGGLGYQAVYFTEEQEKKRAAAEAEAQRREAERIARQPVLRADTRTQADRDRAARQAKQAEYNRLVSEQKDRLMCVGRPNTESQQAAILGMPYVAEAAKNYVQNFDPTAEIRNAMYFVPGVSNVMMAQDAKQAFDNNQTGAGVLNAAFALTPVFGLTPSFKSPLRYTKPANRIGDWTILDYGRNTNTTPVQSTTTPMLGTTNNLMLSSVERPTLSVRPTQGKTNFEPKTRGKINSINTPEQINLPEKFVDFVDKDGNVDAQRFFDFWKYIEKEYGPGYSNQSRIGHSNQSRIEHSLSVAKSAKELPLPKGVSRKDYVQAALLHDIGVAIEGHSKTHGPAGAKILKKIAGTQLSPEQYEAIEKHMDNASFGKGKDLLKAVEFADAARGETLAQALAFHPNLAKYQFEPFNFTGASAAEDFISDMKTRVNPVLKQTGLGTINTNQPIEEIVKQLNDKTRQWRTLIRGARDPKGSSMAQSALENTKNAEELVRKYYGEEALNSNPEFYRTLISTNTVPLENTGGGRAGFNEARHVLDLDENIYDALYASNRAIVGEGYKTGTNTDKGSLGLVRKVYLPFEEYGGESLPSEWMLGNFDWDLLDEHPRQFESGAKTYGLTRFSQFDMPYRLQTGRSFMTDYGNWAGQTQRNFQKDKSLSTPVDVYEYEQQRKDISWINERLENYGFKSISPFNEDGSIIFRNKENAELRDNITRIETLPDKSLKELQDIMDVHFGSDAKQQYNRGITVLNYLAVKGVLTPAQIKKMRYLKFDKKVLIKQALDKYYKKNKYTPTKEYLDQSNMMKFMLEQGVESRVLNPNYLSTIDR